MITLNVAVMRQEYATVPYPGIIPPLSKLLALRVLEFAMVPPVVGQPLLSLPVVPPMLKRRSTVNATLHFPHFPLRIRQIRPSYSQHLNFLIAFGQGGTRRLQRVLVL